MSGNMLKERLLECFKKLGMEYGKKDFKRAGFGVVPIYYHDVETGFHVGMPNGRGHEIFYYLKEVGELDFICSPDGVGFYEFPFDILPDLRLVGKIERIIKVEDLKSYLEPIKEVAIHLNANKEYKRAGSSLRLFKDFVTLIEGAFLDISTNKLNFPPERMRVYFEEQALQLRQHTGLKSEGIMQELKIEETILALEDMCKVIDAKRKK